MAVRHAMGKGKPALKEPIMAVEIVVPDDFIGDVISDINGRRGSITNMEPGSAKTQVVQAFVPLSEMFGYATSLRSMSQGRASYSMEPSHYDQVPMNIAETVVTRVTGRSSR
jgi:elongation factor G